MILTLSPVESFTAVMSGAAATTNPTYSVLYKSESGGVNTPVGSLNGATAVTLVAAPDSGQKQVDVVQIYNGDTAVVTVTLTKVVSGTGTALFSYAIPVGYMLRWSSDGIEIIGTTTLAGVGAVAGTGNVASESGDGVVHKTTITLSAMELAVTDALAYASQKLYDFPAGRILILGTTGSLAWAVTTVRADTINDNAAMDWSVGSAAASSVTLATTMVDLLPKVDKTLDGSVAAFTSASTGALSASAQFDGTGTALDAYLNVSFPTTTDIDADGTLNVTGTVTITWINLGDF